MSDQILSAAAHVQRLAHRQGSAEKSVEIWAWAMKHMMQIPDAPLKELLDMLTKEEK